MNDRSKLAANVMVAVHWLLAGHPHCAEQGFAPDGLSKALALLRLRLFGVEQPAP
jgi:hypothetical protein